MGFPLNHAEDHCPLAPLPPLERAELPFQVFWEVAALTRLPFGATPQKGQNTKESQLFYIPREQGGHGSKSATIGGIRGVHPGIQFVFTTWPTTPEGKKVVFRRGWVKRMGGCRPLKDWVQTTPLCLGQLLAA